MYYEEPEVQEMGRADELVQVIYRGLDMEASTQQPGYCDPFPMAVWVGRSPQPAERNCK